MQIEKKGSGPWAEVSQTGAVVTISLGEDEKVYDCAALQQDAQLMIDVVMGFDGHLAEGAVNGSEYVANLIIPPQRYADVDLPVTLTEEPLPEGADSAGFTPMPVVETVPVPLEEDEMEAIRVILWTVNEIPTHEEMM